MPTPTLLAFPESPKNVNPAITQPSEQFRKEALGVFKSILVFILTYFLLVICATGLAVGCAFGGYWVVVTVKGLWGLIFGLGLVGLGVMVLYFLFKFVFKRNTVDRSGMLEVTAKEQPQLFEFVTILARETHTPLPKKIYVSPDVNASVFYDSSFWSMFLPVRKNLNIGLGLVNCVNVSEFKAIVAHEFGHFSQKSMKLGSYVYNVNHIIHDMLFDNDNYEHTLQSWGNVSNVFAFFAELTRVIVNIIKEILESLYHGMNERYMALSRQMEFHADAVAASVSGSTPLIKALYRLDVAQSCFQNVLGYYDSWIKDNRKGLNAYQHHAIMMNNFAHFHSLKMEHNLPQVTANTFAAYNMNRVSVKDQWASHPSTEDREKHLRDLNIDAEVVTDSAWTLFARPENLQQQVTENLYAGVSFPQKPEIVDVETFNSLFEEQIQRYSYPKEYRGFYDGRNITAFDINEVLKQPSSSESHEDILTDEILKLQYLIPGLQSDIDILESLAPKSSPVKTFDFEGRKYGREEAPALLLTLKKELAEASERLQQADISMFQLFYKKSALIQRADEAVQMYRTMFSLGEQAASELEILNSMLRQGSQLYQANVTEETALAITNNMTRESEHVKKTVREIFAQEVYASCCSEQEKTTLQAFLDDNRKYFQNMALDGEAISLFMETASLCERIISERAFQQKKETLETQMKVIQGEFEYASQA